MHKRRNIMVDIETAGTEPGCAILSIGACEFDPEKSSFCSNLFLVNINLWDSLMEGMSINWETIKWWRAQSKPARDAILVEPQTVKEALSRFNAYLGPRNDEYHLWAKGPDFDLVMMQAVYEKMNMKIPWSYRNARDVRTILWVGGVVPAARDNVTVEHDALGDAIYQAEEVCVNLRAIAQVKEIKNGVAGRLSP